MTPTRTLRNAALTLTAVVPLLAGTTSPASAETETDRDARRDVVRLWSEDTEKAPDNKSADVVRLTSVYDDRRLTITAEVRRLRDRGFLNPLIRTSERTLEAEFWWDSGEKDLSLRGLKNSRKRCKGSLHGSLDKQADTVTFWVPWRCVDRSDWVRTGALVGSRLHDTADVLLVDEARRKTRWEFGELAVLGPKIAYG